MSVLSDATDRVNALIATFDPGIILASVKPTLWAMAHWARAQRDQIADAAANGLVDEDVAASAMGSLGDLLQKYFVGENGDPKQSAVYQQAAKIGVDDAIGIAKGAVLGAGGLWAGQAISDVVSATPWYLWALYAALVAGAIIFGIWALVHFGARAVAA
jgi:hypothetical protein